VAPYTPDVPGTEQVTPSPRGNMGGRRDRQNTRGEATRELILQTAERLFAERGIAAVPLRDIGAAAGQKNNVAVQYHFGDRETLVHEVARTRAGFVEDLLADLVSGKRPLVMTDHVAMFVDSLARNLREDNHYLAFLSRYLIERGGYAGLEVAVSPATVSTLREIMRRALPDLPARVIDERWELMMTTAVHTLARYQMAMHAHALPGPVDELLADLVSFLTAALEAPLGRR
jgi:AcrR family transcriptional regulator